MLVVSFGQSVTSSSVLFSVVHALKFDKSQLKGIELKKLVPHSVSVLATRTYHPLGIEFLVIMKYPYSPPLKVMSAFVPACHLTVLRHHIQKASCHNGIFPHPYNKQSYINLRK